MPSFAPAKGALVRVDDSTSALSAIIFQYNPATLHHSLNAGALSLAPAAPSTSSSGSGTTPPAGGGLPPGFQPGGGLVSGVGPGILSGIANLIGSVVSKKPPPLVPQPAAVVEMIRFTLVLDSADAMQERTEPMASLGLHPTLAALELLLRADAQPVTHATTVFVWGDHRSLPVRLVDLDVHEEFFSGRLNPLHARVHVTLQALDGTEPGAGQAAAALFNKHQRALSVLAQAALSSSLP